jgi:DNA-directed RNA polymerase specialized sigma24 family protein
MSRPARPGPAELTPAQRALFDGEPGLAEEAALAALKGAGEARFRHLAWEEMVSIASVAAMEATATFDPATGEPYRTWGFFAAVHAVLESWREEGRQYAKARALIRASAMVYFGRASASVDIGFETDGTLTAKLHSFTNPVLGLALEEVAALVPTAGGEDGAAEMLAAARAGEALRAVLPAEGSEERRMLEMHFAQRMPLTEVAAAMGVEGSKYRTFVRRFHEVLASLRDGLRKRGIAEMPSWREGVSGRALEEEG